MSHIPREASWTAVALYSFSVPPEGDPGYAEGTKAVEVSEHYPQLLQPDVRIPQGFRLKAQGWRDSGAPTLG